MPQHVSRRTLLRATAAGGLVTAVPARVPVPSAVRELEDRIRAGMERYGVAGVGVGLWYRGREYVRGFGVTRTDAPTAVDGDTVFRVASTTKTFTGAAVMRLVEQGRIDLDRTVRSYLPGFRTADAAASARVTVRQALNHTGGWLGDFFLDTGDDAGALARYVAAMDRLPQLNPPGRVFAYNNAALSLAGRLIEVVTHRPYEEEVRRGLLHPLGLTRSAFSVDDLPGASVAQPHVVDPATGTLVVSPESWWLPRSLHAAGGLISSARDQIRWARFHLGGGGRVLSGRAIRAMRSRPGPGGTLFVELDGAGVTWMLRPTAEGPTVVQHGGDWSGQHSGFLMVPARDVALTVLTNSDAGPALLDDLFVGDWALRRLAGVSNIPAPPLTLTDAELAPYLGRYSGQQIDVDGTVYTQEFEFVADRGRLVLMAGGAAVDGFAFYRKDYVVDLPLRGGTEEGIRANFVRGPDGSVRWFRIGGRLYRRGGTAAATARVRPFNPRPALS
ncbi:MULTISPECIES: serine hydrolase domain-containing protein [Catenuloplanes]|uniref:CubicO group peptidase (Beta-lactamase class C family) n=1 Tax=Catenuloplanes niger TaxID=587534 RepID=A0AAE4CX92_9ACTN|nr:serine hydrolase domain-containing protein [Catenuloplanes niger]MDR7327237.1 CubicO group peptidase (beta-lactamase class C family) [Catenuloplanes niger]